MGLHLPKSGFVLRAHKGQKDGAVVFLRSSSSPWWQSELCDDCCLLFEIACKASWLQDVSTHHGLSMVFVESTAVHTVIIPLTHLGSNVSNWQHCNIAENSVRVKLATVSNSLQGRCRSLDSDSLETQLCTKIQVSTDLHTFNEEQVTYLFTRTQSCSVHIILKHVRLPVAVIKCLWCYGFWLRSCCFVLCLFFFFLVFFFFFDPFLLFYP